MVTAKALKEYAAALKNCKPLQDFKKKYDGRIPRKNSKAYAKYQEEALEAQTAAASLWDVIRTKA